MWVSVLAHVCVIDTCLLKLTPSCEILCPLTSDRAFWFPSLPSPLPPEIRRLLLPTGYNVSVTKELGVTSFQSPSTNSAGPARHLARGCTGRAGRTLVDITAFSNA